MDECLNLLHSGLAPGIVCQVAAAQLSVTHPRDALSLLRIVPPLSRKSENPDDKRQAIQFYLKLAGMVKNIEGVAPEQLALIHR